MNNRGFVLRKYLYRKELESFKPNIPEKSIKEIKKELNLQKIIRLNSNENTIGPSPKAVEAIEKELINVNFYPDGLSSEVRVKLSEIYNISAENIIVSNGADNIIVLIGQAFLNRDEEVIIGDPSFPVYESITNLLGAKMVKVPLKEYKFDLDSIYRNITDKTKMIIICNPNNPTGTILTKEELEEFMDKVSKDIIIVLDEAYFDFVTNSEYPNGLDYVKKNKNIIVVRTFSKILGLAGLRIGYAIAPKSLIGYLYIVLEPFPVNRLAQVGVVAALDDIEYYKNVLDNNKKGKEYLYNELNKMNLFYVPTEANFIFLKTKIDSNILYKKLLRKGIIVAQGSIWGYPKFVRVTIGRSRENKEFINALREILGK